MSAISWYPQVSRLPRLPQRATTFDRQSLYVAVLLMAVAILNVIDLVYTLFAHRIGMLNEMNPVTAAFIESGRVNGLICFKIIMVGGGLGMLWKLRRCRLTIPACWVLVIAYVWLGVVWIQWVQTVNQVFEVRLTSAVP